MLERISYYIIGIFILVTLIFGFIKKINVYDSFIKGVKESYRLALTIFPILLAMYVSINAFSSCGLLDDLFKNSKIPSELFIQGAFRPVSSQASLSMMIKQMNKYGADSKEGIISSILQGGSDTTIYVFGLYFSAIGIKKTRHSYFVGLTVDLICFILCLLLYIYIL